MRTKAQQVLALVRTKGLVRSRDITASGIPRVILSRLVRAGLLERVGRGLYALPGADVSEHLSLAEACTRVPDGIVCLLSALRFHGLTTLQPVEVWLAIDRKSRKPEVSYPPLRVVRFSGPALAHGVEKHVVDGVTIRVTSPARTVADCFRYRSKIGTDVAIDALRDYRRLSKHGIDALWKAAEIRGVKALIRPYLEALA